MIFLTFFEGDVPFLDFPNGCCGNNPCLNGGSCEETCDVKGKRFTCNCGLCAAGKLCETGKSMQDQTACQLSNRSLDTSLALEFVRIR